MLTYEELKKALDESELWNIATIERGGGFSLNSEKLSYFHKDYTITICNYRDGIELSKGERYLYYFLYEDIRIEAGNLILKNSIEISL